MPKDSFRSDKISRILELLQRDAITVGEAKRSIEQETSRCHFPSFLEEIGKAKSRQN